jgi:membrane protease YdiL (CAAX protease family)
VSVDDWSARLGDTVVAIDPTEPDGQAWARAAVDPQIAALRSVSIPLSFTEGTDAALTRIASVNPRVTLLVEDEDSLIRGLALLKPTTVLALGVSEPAALRRLADHAQIETLAMDATKPGSLDVLTALPNLHQLILDTWDVSEAGPLPAVAGLRSLVVADGSPDLVDLTPLRTLPSELESLALVSVPELTGLKGIERLTQLRTIALPGCAGVTDLSPLAALPQLRWAGLPPDVTQEQFAAFTGSHVQLEVVNLLFTEGITDLAPLRSLPGLRGLVLGGPYERVDALRDLTSLRYLAVSKGTFEKAPMDLTELQQALPDALIVQIKPYCLGSGWILLLLPVLIGAWLLQRQAVDAGLVRARPRLGLLLAAIGIAAGATAGLLHRFDLGLPVLPAAAFEPFVLLACLIGATEELVYRGWLFGKIRRFGWPAAIMIATVAHTAYKVALFARPGVPVPVDLLSLALWTMGGGLVLGVLRAASGRVGPAVAGHVAFDLVVYHQVAEAPWWVWG